jgi:citrate lyase subunit beta / citryl-CoA lyase
MARTQLVLHSRLAGLSPPIDGVTADFDKPMLAEHDARRAAEQGFGGKLAIHPKQLASIYRGFEPDEATRRWAEAVVAGAHGGDAAQLNGVMVDRPIIERARRILEHVSR